MDTPQPQYYLGAIKKIVDPDLYEVIVEIPGVRNTELIKAYPMRGEVDEPKPEDLVIVLGLDPVWHSVWLYRKIKENDFIGFRSRGKKIQITKEQIDIGIFAEMNEADQTEAPYQEDSTPASTSWIRIDKDGNIDVHAEGNTKVKIDGNAEVTIDGSDGMKLDITAGDAKINVAGSADIKVDGATTLNCPDVKITGGQLTVKGKACTDGNGPFCGIPVCPVTGAIHTGSIVSGT